MPSALRHTPQTKVQNVIVHSNRTWIPGQSFAQLPHSLKPTHVLTKMTPCLWARGVARVQRQTARAKMYSPKCAVKSQEPKANKVHWGKEKEVQMYTHSLGKLFFPSSSSSGFSQSFAWIFVLFCSSLSPSPLLLFLKVQMQEGQNLLQVMVYMACLERVIPVQRFCFWMCGIDFSLERVVMVPF